MGKRTGHTKEIWRAGALILFSSALLLGAGREEKTFDTTPNPRISLSNVRGQVVVKGWDKSEVHAVWTNSSPHAVEVDLESIPAEGPAEKLHLFTHVLNSKAGGTGESVDYTLDVPVGSSIEIHNSEGSVRIEKLQGNTTVESVDGPISVTDVAGHLAVNSMGGDIEVVRAAGRVEASSITGNLHFVAPTSTGLRGFTTSGKIAYEGDFAPGGEYTLSAYSGDIDILCPANASFELSAKTVKGKVENALSLKPKRHWPSSLSPANSLLGTYNTGNATVQVKSFSGAIRIRPAQ